MNKRWHKLCSLALVLALVLSLMAPAAMAKTSVDTSTNPFTDVTSQDWYDEYVTYAWENGLFQGNGEGGFDPKGELTRAMFVTVLGRMFGVDTTAYSQTVFNDVAADSWYGPYVAWAAEVGIALGSGNGGFQPEDKVTREQLATFLYRYLKLTNQVPEEVESTSKLTYLDANSISDWAKDAVRVCSALGLLQGNHNQFNPTDLATRAEAATVCTRTHQKYGTGSSAGETPAPEATPTPTPDTNKKNDKDKDKDKGNGGGGGGGGSRVNYYKVTVAFPDGMSDAAKAATTLPELPSTVKEGTLISTLDVPTGSGYGFFGWFYDSALTRQVSSEDKVTSNLTLYPKMVSTVTGDELNIPASLNYVAEMNVGTDYTVTVKANSEAQIRESISFLNVSTENCEIDYDIINNGDGTFTLKPVSLTGGATYQVKALDREETANSAQVTNLTALMAQEDQLFGMVDEDGEDIQEEKQDISFINEADYVLFIYNGNVQTRDIIYYNFTVYQKPYDNMKYASNMHFLKEDAVSGFNISESAMYSASLTGENDEGLTKNEVTGFFTYDGTPALNVDDVVTIYANNAKVTTDSNGKTKIDGDSAYVKITKVEGNKYYYTSPDLMDVYFFPDYLPVPLNTAEEGVNGALLDKENGTVLVYNEYLDFSQFATWSTLSLDGTTVAEVGDCLVLYTGTLPEDEPTTATMAEDAFDASYWLITDISKDDTKETTTFKVTETTPEAMENSVGAFEVTNVDSGLSEADMLALEDEIEQEAIDSGFAEEAATYLSKLILSEEEVAGSFGDYNVEDVDVVLMGEWYEGASYNKDWDNGTSLDIDGVNIEGGIMETWMVEVTNLDTYAKISKNLQEISAIKQGIRVELGITFDVQIGKKDVTGWGDCIWLHVSASFVQEVALSANAHIDVQAKKFLFIPYISEVTLSADIDIGSYTGVGAIFSAAFGDHGEEEYFPWQNTLQEVVETAGKIYNKKNPGVDNIAATVQSMASGSFGFLNGKGEEELAATYRQMLENDAGYMEILAVELFSTKILLLGNVITIGISVEMVVRAKMSVTIGVAVENLSVRRYTFTVAIIDRTASSNTVELQTPFTNFDLIIMGVLGLRVGPRLTFSFAVMDSVFSKDGNLAHMDLSVEMGPQLELQGILSYHLEMENGETLDSHGWGGVIAKVGLYLKIDLDFGALADLFSASIHLLDMTYNFWSSYNNAVYLSAAPADKISFTDDNGYKITKKYNNTERMVVRFLNLRTGDIEKDTMVASSWDGKQWEHYFDIWTSDSRFHYYPTSHEIDGNPADASSVDFEVCIRYNGHDSGGIWTEPVTTTIPAHWERTAQNGEKTEIDFNIPAENSIDSAYYADTKFATQKVPMAMTIQNKVDPGTVNGSMNANNQAGYEFVDWVYEAGYLKDANGNDVPRGKTLTELNNLVGYSVTYGARFRAVYRSKDDTKYTMEYYVSNPDKPEQYDLYKSVEHSGKTGYVSTDVLKANIDADMGGSYPKGLVMDQLRFPGMTPAIENGKILGYLYKNQILGDGTSVFRVYYDRVEYSVYFHANNQSYTGTYTNSVKGPWGAEMSVPVSFDNNTIPGYDFKGWATTQTGVDENGNSTLVTNLPTTIPMDVKRTTPLEVTYKTSRYGTTTTRYYSGTHYFAIWEPRTTTYTVEYYLQQEQGDYELITSETKSGLAGTYIELPDIPDSVDYMFVKAKLKTYRITDAKGNSTSNLLDGTNTQTMKIYYTRTFEKYRVNWGYWDNLTGYHYLSTQNITIETDEGYHDFITVTAPDTDQVPQKNGYKISGWTSTRNGTEVEYTSGQQFQLDLTGKDKTSPTYFYPVYEPRDDISYTVTHVRENLNGRFDHDDQTLIEVETFYGKMGETVTPATKTYGGFKAPEVQSLTISGDESRNTVRYIYNRQLYSITYEEVDENQLDDLISWYEYGMILRVPSAGQVTRTGYTLTSWEIRTEDGSLSFIVGAGIGIQNGIESAPLLTSQQNLICKAIWEKKTSGYVVEHYLEKLDGSYTIESKDAKVEVKYGTTATAMEKTFVGFTYDSANANNVTTGTVGEDTLTLKLYYKRNEYTVTWTSYDGNTELATTQVKYGATITPPDKLDNTRSGFTMTGWKSTDYPTMGTENKTLSSKDYGDWKSDSQTYTVHFDQNAEDATGTMADQTITRGTTATLMKNSFTSSSHTFTGWALTTNGGVVYGDEAEITSDLVEKDEDEVTLYAVWKEREVYDLTLNFNTESMKTIDDDRNLTTFDAITSKKVEVDYGATLADIISVAETESSLNKDGYAGYTFDGWYDESGNKVTETTTMPKKALKLTAKWTPIKITVTWYHGSYADFYTGVTGEPHSQQYDYGTEISLPTEAKFQSPNGYKLVGWTFSDGSSSWNAASFTSWPLVLVYGYHSTEYFKNGTTLNLGAFWSNSNNASSWIQIAFYSNGGSGTMEEQFMDVYGGGNLNKNQYTKDGYTFAGWNTEQDGSGTMYDDRGWVSASTGTTVTLYAQWTENT